MGYASTGREGLSCVISAHMWLLDISVMTGLRARPVLQVSAKRRVAGVLSAVIGAFSDELAAYSTAAGIANRATLWDRGSLDALPVLEE